MGGRAAEKRRLQTREQERADVPIPEATLRQWAASELPDLTEPNPWTPEMVRIVANLYRIGHQPGHQWECWHQCGRVVARFGQQCPSCLEHEDELGPVDWDSVGLEQ